MPGHSLEATQIDPKELKSLSERYGRPLCRHFCIETDAYMREYRGQKDPDRRGEVVFASATETYPHRPKRKEPPMD